MTQYTQNLDSGTGNPTAVTFTTGVVDSIMHDGVSRANLQPVALALLQDNGDGTFGVTGYVGPDAPSSIKTYDDSTSQKLDAITTILNALQLIVNEAGSVGQLAAAMNDFFGRTAPLTLDDTTPKNLFATASDDTRIDIIGLVIANLDTAEAVIDFTCGTQTTPIIVEAKKTLPVNIIMRGSTNTSWTAALRANPAAATVEITATARIAPAGF